MNMSKWLFNEIFLPTYKLSNGLVFPNLIVGIVLFSAMILLICRPAKLPLTHIGWKQSTLKSGCLIVIVTWLALQVAAVLAALIGGHGLALHSDWTTGNYSGVGRLIGQLIGTAPFEESLFRGILPVQLFFWLSKREPRRVYRWVVITMLLSAIAFAVPHIPNRILNNSYTGLGSVIQDQLLLMLAAIVFLWVYLSTGNLWFVIGLHSLINAPTLIVASPIDGSSQVILLIAMLGVSLTPRLRRFLSPIPCENESDTAFPPGAPAI